MKQVSIKDNKTLLNIHFFLEYGFDINIGTEIVSVRKKICMSAGHDCFSGRADFGFCGYRTMCQQVYMSLHYNETQPTTIRIPNGCQCVRMGSVNS